MVVPTDPYYEDLSGINAYDPAKEAAADRGRRDKPHPALQARRAAVRDGGRRQVAADLKAVGINTTIQEQQFPAAWVDAVYIKADYDLTIVGHAEARDLVTYTNPEVLLALQRPGSPRSTRPPTAPPPTPTPPR